MNIFWEQISSYAEACASREPLHLLELRRITKWNTAWHQMLCSPAQGRFLSFISRLLKPSSVLELGTFTGYSAACLAEGLHEKGTLITLDHNPETMEMAIRFFDKINEKRIRPILTDIAEWFEENTEKQFDLIFIDADKGNYPYYFEQSARRIRNGGVIIMDNVLWKGWVIDNSVKDPDADILRELTSGIVQRNDFLTMLIPLRDGMLVCFKK
jgi:predicted O-methyltransferase YrrM